MNTRRIASREAFACFICGTVHAGGDKVAEADGRHFCPSGCASQYDAMAPDMREDLSRVWGGRVLPEVQDALDSALYQNRNRVA